MSENIPPNIILCRHKEDSDFWLISINSAPDNYEKVAGYPVGLKDLDNELHEIRSLFHLPYSDDQKEFLIRYFNLRLNAAKQEPVK